MVPLFAKLVNITVISVGLVVVFFEAVHGPTNHHWEGNPQSLMKLGPGSDIASLRGNVQMKYENNGDKVYIYTYIYIYIYCKSTMQRVPREPWFSISFLCV